MGWEHSLAHLLARRLAPDDLVAVASEALPSVMERVPSKERVAFLLDMIAASVDPLLRNRGRGARRTHECAAAPGGTRVSANRPGLAYCILRALFSERCARGLVRITPASS